MPLRKAVVITAFNRPNYFRQALESWMKVRGREDWDIFVSLEPAGDTFFQQHVDIIKELDPDCEIDLIPWKEPMGVLEHPFKVFELFFEAYDFVVRAEDDLLVSDDILEYFSWAAERHKNTGNLATVHAFTELDVFEGHPASAYISGRFNSWVWGTWRHQWERHIRDTWDHDYSTYNGTPYNESGWDWNLDTRVLPERNLYTLLPAESRVQNIGVWGVHGTPDNLKTASTFKAHREPVSYEEVTVIR